MRLEGKVKIKNPQGLHARPAALLAQIANKYDVAVSLKKGSTVVDGRSIMGILMLEATLGSEIDLIVEGESAQEAFSEIKELLENEGTDE